MAKKRKSFSSLPKRAKRAAFAAMEAAGTLKAKGKSGKRTGAKGSGGGKASFAERETIKGFRVSRNGGLIRVMSPGLQVAMSPTTFKGRAISNQAAIRNLRKANKSFR